MQKPPSFLSSVVCRHALQMVMAGEMMRAPELHGVLDHQVPRFRFSQLGAK
jgi:hypothetical protein